MKFTKKLEKFFLALALIPILYLAYNFYNKTQFKSNPLPEKTLAKVQERKNTVLSLIQQNFNLHVDFPLIISDEFNSNLFGLTTYKDGEIKIYLNKKRFKESQKYMIEEVIPHEYAHAMVMALGKRTSEDGHTDIWQKICLKLDGKFCERYVDNEELVRQKIINIF